MNPPENILIIQTAFIGDVILTTPLIRETKRTFPKSHIDVLVIPQTKELLFFNPHLRSLLVFDKRGDKRRAFFNILDDIREHRYDLCLLPHKSMTSALLAYLGGIPIRIGFRRGSGSALLNRKIDFDKNKRQLERYLDLLIPFSTQKRKAQTELFYDDRIRERAQLLLESLQKCGRVCAVAPGSVWNTKRWPAEYFVRLLRMFELDDIGFLLLGSRSEYALCESIAGKVGKERIINLAGQTSLLEAAAVIQKCDLLLCNDSGTMHMANAVQTDVFAFFGPTVESFGFTPYRAGDVVFQVELYCRPCTKHGGHRCPENHFRCMREIQPEQVYQAIVQKCGIHKA